MTHLGKGRKRMYHFEYYGYTKAQLEKEGFMGHLKKTTI